jgi:hypothetical protein
MDRSRLEEGKRQVFNIFRGSFNFISKIRKSMRQNAKLTQIAYVYLPFIAVLRIRIRDPVPFWPLDPGPGIGFFRIPDLGSRIPNPYIWEHSEHFLGKTFNNSLKIGPNFFLQHFINKIIFSFVKFVTTKKVWSQFFFHPSLLLLFFAQASSQ